VPMFAKDSELKIEGNEIDGATLQVCVLHYLPIMGRLHCNTNANT